jgi:DNA-binding GntR family transcriptional regulator
MEAISDLPMPHDMDADYSPQYVKLARVLRDRIKAGDLECRAALPASGLAAEYAVSLRVAHAALEMLEANRYVTRPRRFQCYRVTWQAGQ